MNIGDLFVKLADGTPLSQEEKQQLRLYGNQTQLNNSFVAGLQNGISEINVSNARVSGNIYTGKDVVSGIAIRLKRTSSLSLASGGATTTIDWDVEDYDDGNFFDANVSTQNVTVLYSGRYTVSIGGFISGASSIYSITTMKNGVSYYPAIAIASGGWILSATDEREYEKGDVITVDVINYAGSTSTLASAYFTMRLTRFL